MANDINRVILVGRLTRDPELKNTNSGTKLCNFTLASNRTQFVKDGENIDHVGYFDCVAWGKLGEIISKYAVKGQRVGVDGNLHFSSWENADGKKQSRVTINVENFEFLDNKKSGESGQSDPAQQPNEDDIPF